MGRRKDYKLPDLPETFLGAPGALVIKFPGMRRSLDFAGFARRHRMAAELAFAFRHHLVDKKPISRIGAFAAVRTWFRYLDDVDPKAQIQTIADVDAELLRGYIAWLNRQPVSKGTQYSAWAPFSPLIKWLARNCPNLVSPDVEVPRNPFPRRQTGIYSREVLSASELNALLSAARTEIEESWATFQAGREALARIDPTAIAAEQLLRKLDLNDLGVLLRVLIDRFGGVVPPLQMMVMSGAGLSPLEKAIRRHGGAYRLTSYLHATPRMLTPYMIAIAAETFANPEALRCLRRECMIEHLLIEGRVVVTWTKNRSSLIQRRSFLRNRKLSVPSLIDRVLALTQPLLAHVPPDEQKFLFLCGWLVSTRQIGLIPMRVIAKHIPFFAIRHNLRDDRGRPLKLTLARLRATGLTLAHTALGHDIVKTQALANHASPCTTRRYIDIPMVRAAQAAELGGLQARFVEVVRAEAIGTKPTQAGTNEAEIVVGNATASGFVCSDPLSGVGPGQRKGHLCTAWLGCFTCPNAVIPMEPEILARLMRTRLALLEAQTTMAPERWQMLYAAKLEILEHDVLPRFPEELHTEARTLLSSIPPTPPVE